MVMPQSLTARILLAFAAIMVTFTAVTLVTVAYMDDVRDEMQILHNVYLPAALASKDLARKQQELHEYVADNLADETSMRRMTLRITALRQARDQLLSRVDETLRTDVPSRHGPRIARARALLMDIKSEIDALASPYQELLQRTTTNASTSANGGSADGPIAPAIQTRLESAEKVVAMHANGLADEQARVVTMIARNLVFNEERLRWYSLVLGAAVWFVSLLVAVWIAGSIRSIWRLRDAARHVAAGRYDHRIPSGGPSEVRDLAQEFNQMSERVQDRERELVRSARLVAMGRMAATITHEVRNPLSSISLNAELLAEDLQGSEHAEARALCLAITAEVERLTNITEEYLEFSRLPTPKRAVEDVVGLAKAVVAFMHGDAAKRQIQLRITDAQPELWAEVDAAQLRQCLVNLIRNSFEALAGRPNAVVEVRVESYDNHIHLLVEDNGPGFSDDALARLFEAFYTTKPGGSGLGLALTQQIVHEHGGRISAATSPMGGAQIRIELSAAVPGA